MFKVDMIVSLKSILKEQGFKKIRNYWYKVQNEMTFYLNIQGSAYSSDDFYVNFGIVLSSFKEKIPPIYEWDVCRRVFVDGKQTNFDLADVLLMFDYFLNLFPTVEETVSFVNSQKKQYQHIIISERYMLA